MKAPIYLVWALVDIGATTAAWWVVAAPKPWPIQVLCVCIALVITGFFPWLLYRAVKGD